MFSLIATAPDAEIIVGDNGEELADSEYLLDLTHKGSIASYTRYRQNMHFAYARNDCLKRASREYIAVSDNDILFSADWLEQCVAWLDRTPGKFLATPIAVDPMNHQRKDKYGETVNGWRTHQRAGSNIWVMRRSDFEVIGNFDILPKAGSKWTDRYIRMGYMMGVMPEAHAHDMGLRKGYMIHEPIKRFKL